MMSSIASNSAADQGAAVLMSEWMQNVEDDIDSAPDDETTGEMSSEIIGAMSTTTFDIPAKHPQYPPILSK